jgi:aspartate/methionine/tyrosine aminotransferase
MKYGSDTPSFELCERVRTQQSVLIVPGAHLGLEGYIRVWLGGKPEFLSEGLRRIGVELHAERERARG